MNNHRFQRRTFFSRHIENGFPSRFFPRVFVVQLDLCFFLLVKQLRDKERTPRETTESKENSTLVLGI